MGTARVRTGQRVWLKALVVAGVSTLGAWALWVPAASATPPTVGPVSIAKATTTSAILEAPLNPQGKATRYHFEYGSEACSSVGNPCTSVPVPESEQSSGSTTVTVSFLLEGLVPGTVYHARIVAKHPSEGEAGVAKGPDRVFATYLPSLGGLPDGRAYEQSSPVDKNGDDAEGIQALVKATTNGDGITFLSTFGLPGGVGAQAQPTYLATRESDRWSTRGLLPSATLGEDARVLGWLPDFSVTYSSVTKFGNPGKEALVAQPKGQTPVLMTPYVHAATYYYAGATSDGSVVFFESQAKLPPEEGKLPIAAAVEGASNLYAWDRESGRISLVSVLNGETPLSKGGFAGPFDWARGNTGLSVVQGGAERDYFLQEGHVVTPGGDVYFTASGSGQLYLRENPIQPQSLLNGEGKCIDSAKACTVHVSVSHRTGGPDTAGSQPAAFQAASVDGESSLFTSPEMLTDNANTGPEQPLASIARGEFNGESIQNVEQAFIPKRAVGLAENSEYIYWADPVDGTIGRAKLNGEPASIDDAFITPGPTECEPGIFEASKPRYVTVNAEHIYWTNTGCLDVPGEPKTEGGGTIGRASLDGGGIEPACVPGRVETSPGVFTNQVTNPQGIAANAEHIYWANDPYEPVNQTIARASTDCGSVEPRFEQLSGREPFGVALDGTYLYFAGNSEANNRGFILRVPLGGGSEEEILVGKGGVRGVAVEGTHVYWAAQNEGAIGRAATTAFQPLVTTCETTAPDCMKKFLTVIGTPAGLSADTTHLHWSVNGETPPNPGNDLYRFEPASGELKDLTPDSAGDGAEVLGVLGSSADGSYVYFAANGDLDGGGPANAGEGCHSSVLHGPLDQIRGHCNLYLWHDGTTSFVAELDASDDLANSDAMDWAPTGTVGGSYLTRASRVSKNGQTLLFRSREKLSDYENEGVPEFYLYRVGEAEPIRCVSCNPSGEAPGEGPRLGRIDFLAGVKPSEHVVGVLSRNLSGDGSRIFFETPESLTPADVNGEQSCPINGYPACEDVYEWEVPGVGSCSVGAPSYSALDRGCVYLISTGHDSRPSLFGDASESGNNVFFFTFQKLVGQDDDELRDVYDARVEGGLSSQNPPPKPPPCESPEACRPPVQAPPAEATPGSKTLQGPPNPTPKRKKAKHHARHHQKPHRKAHSGQMMGK